MCRLEDPKPCSEVRQQKQNRAKVYDYSYIRVVKCDLRWRCGNVGAECEVQYRAVRVGLAQYAKHKGRR